MKHNSDFRYDLDTGILGETEYGMVLKDLIDGKHEIKSEQDTWKETGNMFVEYKSRGKDSGITTTQADHWVVSFYKGKKLCFTLSLPIENMKKIARKYYNMGRKTEGGDENTSRGVLVPISSILYFNY